MRTVIFDLDGTLADTSGDLIAAANASLAVLGQPAVLDPVRDAGTAFAGGRAMLRLGFTRAGATWTEADVDRGYPILLEAYRDEIDRHTTLYPGAVAAVEALRLRGDRIGICTNKPEGLAETLIRKLGIRDLFDALVGADTFPVRKPDPLPYREAVTQAGGMLGRSLLVGDTVTDRDTARAAGVPVILVTFGPTGREVSAFQPDALLDRFDDLPAISDRLIPA